MFPAFLSYSTLPCSSLLSTYFNNSSPSVHYYNIIELTPGPIPRAISWLRGLHVTQAERKKTQEREGEGKGYTYTGRKDNGFLLWHGL